MRLFDLIQFIDPVTQEPLKPRVESFVPSAGPLCGIMRRDDNHGYPIVDAVSRLTPALAKFYAAWLAEQDCEAPELAEGGAVQLGESVASFGFQWAWSAEMRTADDLVWRVARRFNLDPSHFHGRLVLDAGCGAGDQSRWLLEQGARVVSLDLSEAIDITARKLRTRSDWVGVQGDLLALPFADAQFDIVYCEGVIQHTADSGLAMAELARVLKPGGQLLATHYVQSERWTGKMRERWQGFLRGHLSRLGRFELQLVTGVFAALAHIPVFGLLFRSSGTALYSKLMPEFSKTWVNTFDYYGSHQFQRLMPIAEFWRLAERSGLELTVKRPGVLAARAPG